MMTEPVVLHVSTPLSWRGGEQQAIYLFEELDALGIKQHILCSSGSKVKAYCKERNYPHSTQKKSSSVSLSCGKAVKNACAKHGANIVHVHDAHAHTFAVLAATFFGNKVPIVVSRRVDFPVSKSPLSKWKYNHRMVKRIVCVSDCIRQITAPAIKRKEMLTTVHSGIDLGRFTHENTGKLRADFGIGSDTLIIGNVAALAPHKDYRTFIRTAAALKQKGVNAKYLIVGEGDERRMIEREIQEMGLSNDVIMGGFRGDVPEILPEFDVFLITSETEGLGTSILDAMACKVPVVAAKAGGIPEIVLHEQTGLLAEVKDHDGLAKQVLRVVNDEQLKSQLVAGATKHLQSFQKGETAKRTLAVYREILSA